MSTVTKGQFQLQRSRVSMVLQLSTLALMLLILMQLWSFVLVILAALVAIAAYLWFLSRPQICFIEHLDKNQWVIVDQAQHIEHQQLTKIIDHHLYIMLYFKQHQAICVWRDQLSFKQWKQLKVLAQLHVSSD